MEQQTPNNNVHSPQRPSNKILVKALITAGLILAMLIPTMYITDLVYERQNRQQQVVAEVSNGWAAAQTLSGPFIVVPYHQVVSDTGNKKVAIKKEVVLLPENLKVTGSLFPEKRKRSIYTVLLYTSNIKTSGVFNIVVPKELDANKLIFDEAKICMGVSDFKGIQEKVAINFNGVAYELNPGLPASSISHNGLSASIPLSISDLSKDLLFTVELKLKGSEQLSFVPLSGNSNFTLQSDWPDPPFNGSTLPSVRQVDNKGFTATWSFNKANLPFGRFLADADINEAAHTFGVSMLQPANHYAKTMRSVKYAILFIGLTFSLFFIVELLQNKPVHPVQYILVGLALVIFYSLLLSFSEFIPFDQAYLIAAAATVSLITLYVKSHFTSWKIAGLFAGVIGGLYIFIFVLIRLEDTALLVGSIGLFGILAVAMYFSRKVNWYPTNGNFATLPVHE